MNDPHTSAATPVRCALWNPSAAANWSLLFTPAFGAYLQMLNWRALGEPERAIRARIWFTISVAVSLASLPLAAARWTEYPGSPIQLATVAVLVGWYFAGARDQVRYVKEKFGETYERRPWGKALWAGVAALFGYCGIAFLVGVVAALLS